MLYILVPVYNRLSSTKDFLKSLYSQDYKSFEVIIINDGSTDNTEDFIKENYPQIHLLKGKGNLFWGGAINKGLEYIENFINDDDFIVFANNDVILKKNSVINLMKRVKLNRRALYHPIAIDSSGTCISSGSQLKSWFLFNTYHPFRGKKYNKIDKFSLVQVDFATARFLLFSAKLLQEVNRIDVKRFKHYTGDYDFSMQMKKHLVPTYIVPDSVCTVDTNTTGNNPSQINGIHAFLKSLKSIKSTNNLKVRFSFGKKYCPKIYLPFYYIAVLLQVIILNLRKK